MMPKTQLENHARILLWRSSLHKFLHGSKAILKRHGVSSRAYHGMLELWAAPKDDGLSVGELADLLHLRHNSAVGVVDVLCAKGFATRSRGDHDKRVVHVRLTDEGRMVLAALVDDHLRELGKVSADLHQVVCTYQTHG